MHEISARKTEQRLASEPNRAVNLRIQYEKVKSNETMKANFYTYYNSVRVFRCVLFFISFPFLTLSLSPSQH